MTARDWLKASARALACVAVTPMLLSYFVRARLLGPDRALEGSTQALSLVPGLSGQYLRRAFLARTLAACHPTATIEFGTTFSQTGARIGARAYVGPRCQIGLAHIEADALLAGGVQVPSGRHTHGTDPLTAIRDQPLTRTLVRVRAGSWIGAGAIVMADVGRHAIVGAGSVVTQPIADRTVAAGVPARVIRDRGAKRLVV
jgi:acetyltransferase-like isoleucine patch superfamily enzyme